MHDKVVIETFLRGYCAAVGKTVPSVTFPDETERNAPAPDALATWPSGENLAIEHTLIQPFPDEQYKLKGEIGTVFEPLRDDSALRVPGYQIWLKVPLDAVPKGSNRDDAARAIREWVLAIRDRLKDGWAEEKVPGLGFDLSLTIYKQFVGRDSPGIVSITYVGERTKGHLEEVLTGALGKKLPKLLSFSAQMRFLLFEKNVRSYNTCSEIQGHLAQLMSDYPGLPQVNTVWVVDTSEVDRQGKMFCTAVWPHPVETVYFHVEWAAA